jgi:hypothetical protein
MNFPFFGSHNHMDFNLYHHAGMARGDNGWFAAFSSLR